MVKHALCNIGAYKEITEKLEEAKDFDKGIKELQVIFQS